MTTAELFSAAAEHVTRRFGTFDIRITGDTPALSVPAGLIVLTRGDVRDGEHVLCHVTSACVTSTALDSAECDCDLQNYAALARIDGEGRGVLIYLTDQEGRDEGLNSKVRARANKNQGMDMFEAVEAHGPEPDVRTYDAVPPILDALGVRSVVLLSASQDKRNALKDLGVEIERMEALYVAPHRRATPSMWAKRAGRHATPGEYTDDPMAPYP